MPYTRLLTYLCCLLLIPELLLAQGTKATLQGKVKDENGKPISEVHFGIANSTIGGNTDDQGNYSVSLDAGTHTVIFSILGYEQTKKKISLKRGEVKILDIQMRSKDIELRAFEKKTIGVKLKPEQYILILKRPIK